VDDIVTRLQDHPHTLVSDCRCIRCEAANEIERLRPRRLDLRRVSEWPEGQTEQNYDIVSQLRHPWEYDNLNFEVLCDYAADEIERLRALCNDLYHDATCDDSFCRLCGEGIREWEARREQ
jgi:hypothetical protein